MPRFTNAIINQQWAMYFVENKIDLVYFYKSNRYFFILHIPTIARSSIANLILTYY